jgi:hypothetical protein
MNQPAATSPSLLVKRLHARAHRDQVPYLHPLRARARELEAAIPLYYAQQMGPRAFMRLYARACKAWRDHTGEFVL